MSSTERADSGWAPDADGFERRVFWHRGYDCGPGGSLCKHEHKGDHGIHGDEIVLALRRVESGAALTLTVYSSYMEGAYEPRLRWSERPESYGADVSLHVAFQTDVERLRNDEWSECSLLPTGKCAISSSSSLAAQDVWGATAAEGASQIFPMAGASAARFTTALPDVWGKLRALFDNWYASARRRAAELPAVCPCCNGAGIVPREGPAIATEGT